MIHSQLRETLDQHFKLSPQQVGEGQQGKLPKRVNEFCNVIISEVMLVFVLPSLHRNKITSSVCRYESTLLVTSWSYQPQNTI